MVAGCAAELMRMNFPTSGASFSTGSPDGDKVDNRDGGHGKSYFLVCGSLIPDSPHSYIVNFIASLRV